MEFLADFFLFFFFLLYECEEPATLDIPGIESTVS